MNTITYRELNKWQKIALLLVVIGEENAARLLKDFDDDQVETICREIANFRIIETDIQEQVLREFAVVVSGGFQSLLGGPAYAAGAIRRAKGEFRSSHLMGRITPEANSMEVIQEIGDMEPRQIYNLIRYEQPQTIAFVISYLSQEKAGAVIGMLDTEIREDIVERIGLMEDTNLDCVGKVAGVLKRHINDGLKQTQNRTGGVREVADILNKMGKEESRIVLASLEQRNPELGEKIRRKMFSFDDLIRLETLELQRITREIEMQDLVLAMKSSNAALQEAIFSSVSRRAAESLREEIEMLGPVRLKEVEAAQDRIIQIVRRLEEEGEISLDKGGGDNVLV